MTKEQVLKIKDYVKSPATGSKNYGKWGALRADQRKLINDLCDSWLNMYEHEVITLKTSIFEQQLNDYIRRTDNYVKTIK